MVAHKLHFRHSSQTLSLLYVTTIAARKDERMIPIREEIYIKQGYYVLRNFIEPYQAEYIVLFWQESHNQLVTRFRKEVLLVAGCPDYSTVNNDRTVHYNFFWNRPKDWLTYDVCWRIQRLRNEIEGNPVSENYLPFQQTNLPDGTSDVENYRAVSFRIVGSRNGAAVAVHRDWPHDLSRIQMSLILTAWGQDYSEGGFVFRTPDGVLRNLGREESLRPGDLLIFRYSNEHGVESLKANNGQRGFWRILFPIEVIRHKKSLASALRSRLSSVPQRAMTAIRKQPKYHNRFAGAPNRPN